MLLVYLGIAVLVYMQFGAGANPRRNRNLCIWIVIYLFLISAMKEILVNGDLVLYARAFRMMKSWSYSRIFESWMDEQLKDGFFYVIAKVFADIGCSDYVWMGFISLVYAVSVGWFIYKNSSKPFLSLMLLMTLGFYKFTLSGLRQTLSMAMILALSYGYMLDRKPIKFLLSVLLAALFHSSAILFLPAYFVCTWKLGWRQAAMVGGVFVVYFLFPNLIRDLLMKIAWNRSIAEYATRTKALTWSGVVIQACILVFCFLFRNETILDPYNKWRKVDAFINCMLVGFCLQILATMIAEAFRLAYYYNLCSIAVIANEVAENKREQNHSTMYIIIGSCLVAYMLWSQAFFDITFFWQI